MTGPLYALGRLAAAPRIFIGAWIALAVGLVAAAAIAGSRRATNLTIPGSDSTKATDLLDAKLRAVPTARCRSRSRPAAVRLDQGRNETP